ncbi:MAG: DNA polymerase III subunit alpha [Planctomycetes bacterium]|nr:DNA polymerase III subunit alpha [Planctomycetota bacterium]
MPAVGLQPRRLGAVLAGWEAPALAVRTHFSPLEGVHAPAVWAEALGSSCSLGEQCGRVLLADRDSLSGLPATIAAWGRERIAVGATVRWAVPGVATNDDHDVVLLAPTASAYAHLCRLLSWQAEEPTAWMAWQDGAGRDRHDLGEIVALVRHDGPVTRLRDAGAEVWWRCGLEPDPPPVGLPAAALPVLTHLGTADRVGDAVRHAVAHREGRVAASGVALTDLVVMRVAFRHHGFLLDAGRDLLARCAYVPGGSWHMPPSHYADADGELRQRAEAGMRRRYTRETPEIRQRLDHELAVISAKGFSGYLLTVADLAAGRRTCGRGSGASSLVVYCLGITNVDPIRYHLLFERFLNPARIDPPDLDVDFPWDERDAVLAAAMASYGRDHVAMVANHNHLRRWSALRVVARAYGRSDGETTAVRAQVKAHERYGMPLRLAEPWPGILAQAKHLIGIPHHAGLHCGGVVITREPLRDLVPIHPAAKHIALEADPDDEAPPPRVPVPAISWEKDGAEIMGLVKIDFLGNRSLAVVRDTITDLAEDGVTIDEHRWRPADDPLTRRLVASGNTLGCFYIESPAMRQLQAKAGSGDFDRLVIHSSIIRPAANRWINTYLDRLAHHRATGQHLPEWYPHPALRGLLSESYGILSYQEDVMLAAVEIAGFDDRQANALRKALGLWDTQARLTRFADEFRRGAENRGATPEAIATVWGMIASFAGYSFCKAHSASYAMVSFQCAYLLAHHPAYFLARVIANEGGFYQPSAYLEEARRSGIRILGLCVIASGWATVRAGADALRIGLHLLPGLSAESGRRLVAERERRPFAGIADLRRRVGLSASQLDILARVGALDALCPECHRDQVIWVATSIGLNPLVRGEEDDDGVVQRIFPVEPPRDPTPPVIPPRSARVLAWEIFSILGFLPAGHPIHFCDRRGDHLRCRDLTAGMAKSRVRLVAWPITRKQVEAKPKPKPGSSAGPPEPMAFVTLEDETGRVETVWFPQAYRTYGPLLDRDRPLRLQGVVEVSYGAVTLTVQSGEVVEPTAQ